GPAPRRANWVMRLNYNDRRTGARSRRPARPSTIAVAPVDHGRAGSGRPRHRVVRIAGNWMSSASPPSFSAPTPIPISPRVRTALIIAGIVLIAVLMNAAPIVPRLLILGAALALVLSFPVTLLERIVSRRLAILIVVLGLFILIAIAVLVFVPILVSQLTELVSNFPRYIEQVQDLPIRSLEWLRERGLSTAEPQEVVNTTLQQIVNQAQSVAQDMLASVLDAITQTVSA